MHARLCGTAQHFRLCHPGAKVLGVQSQSFVNRSIRSHVLRLRSLTSECVLPCVFPESRSWCRLSCSATGSRCVPHEGSSSQGQYQSHPVKPVCSPTTVAAANHCADICLWAATAVRTRSCQLCCSASTDGSCAD